MLAEGPLRCDEIAGERKEIKPLRVCLAAIRDAVLDVARSDRDTPISARALRRFIETLPTTILRVKGFVFTQEEPQQPLILQLVGPSLTLTRAANWTHTPRTRLVLIGVAGFQPAEIEQRFAALAA